MAHQTPPPAPRSKVTAARPWAWAWAGPRLLACLPTLWAACQLAARPDDRPPRAAIDAHGPAPAPPDATTPAGTTPPPASGDATPPGPPAGPAAADGAAGEPPPLVVDLGPALRDRAARDAAEAHAAGDDEEAARLYEQLLQGRAPGDPGWYETTLMAGLAHLGAGAAEKAAGRLAALADTDHPLRPFVRLKLSRAEMQASRPVRALAALEGEWEPPYEEEAVRVRAEALLDLERPREAVDILEAWASRTRRAGDEDAPRKPPARLLLARARLDAARREDPEPAGEALERCRETLGEVRGIRGERAGTADGDEADGLLREYVSLVPRAERAAFVRLTTAERVERVRRLTTAYRYDDAQREAEELLDDVAADDPLRCPVVDAAGDAWFRARDYERAADVLGAAVDACRGADAWVDVAWRTARARLNSRDPTGAAELFEELERTAPQDDRADDARLQRAEIALAAGDASTFEDLARGVVERHADGDRVDAATWLLGWYRLTAGRHEEAAADFAALLRRGWTSPEAAQGGRARYWHGVALEALGRETEALDEYRRVLGDGPFTWYGLLAYGRLRLRDAAAARALVDRALVRAPAPADEPLELPDVPVVRSEGFRRALLFLQLGLYEAADAEVAVLRRGPGLPARASAALSALAQRAGAYRLGRRLGGAGRSPLGRDPLTDETARAWAAAYPRGFAATVDEAAAAQRLPAAFVFGIIHEESGFEPRAFSSAHAVGLMQLLVPTAERFAEAGGIAGRITRRRLNRPSVNVPIGAAYLRFLADRYPDRLVLVPAAYNAGEGRLDRWLRERGDLPLDRFVESIPYDQTRTYLMRVVSSWAVYQALYRAAPGDEPLPVLDPTVVARPAGVHPPKWGTCGSAAVAQGIR